MTDPVHCTACGHQLPSADAGPCPKCGSTAKTFSAVATAHSQSTARAVAVVVPISELRNALRNNPSEILVTAPAWLPATLLFLFALAVIIQLSIPSILAFKGLSQGYNVELCPKISIPGVGFSNCVKLT